MSPVWGYSCKRCGQMVLCIFGFFVKGVSLEIVNVFEGFVVNW